CCRLAALMVVSLPAASRAQGLPRYQAVNPVLTSRSGLYFQPYVDSTAHRWKASILLDYGSAVEFTQRETGELILDAELLRLDLTAVHDVGKRGFAGATVNLNGSYGGFLDGFLNWYHKITGLPVAARNVRPNNAFTYEITLPDGQTLTRGARSMYFGDARLFAGYRLSSSVQAVVAATVPTSTAPPGYGRGTVSVSGIATARFISKSRWGFEGSGGVGFTPRHGDLAAYQNTLFYSGSGGVRYRFAGKQAVFANLFVQSANYQSTTLPALDKREMTLDYGFLLRAKKGPEWFLGMTEDLEPKGPAIDLSFRIGARW
ncbi:MAG: DUF3187 family protein, partial [Gemmatimonadota bacterium]